MDIHKIGSASLLLLCIGGCGAPVPVAENFPISYQKVARTAQHWDVIAADVVAQTANTLASKEQLHGRPVLVVPLTRKTAFDAAFNDFLINQMVDRGIQVSVCEPGGTGMIQDPEVKVKYQARVIVHATAPQYHPGLLTALVAGVDVVRMIGDSDISRDGRWLLGIGTAGVIDAAAGYLTPATRTEVVVTTTIEEHNRFIMRRSDIYYVPDGDATLFMRRVKQNALCESPSRKETVATLDEDKEEADREARYELFVKNMRQVNPKWRPAAWSYSD